MLQAIRLELIRTRVAWHLWYVLQCFHLSSALTTDGVLLVQASNPHVSNSIGRVAAAASMFGRDSTNQTTPAAPPPPALPRRTTSTSDDSTTTPQEPPGRPPMKPKPMGAPGLVSIKVRFTMLCSKCILIMSQIPSTLNGHLN